MAEDERSAPSASSDAEAVRLARAYDQDPRTATEQIRRSAVAQKATGAILQGLGKLGRGDIVLAATETISFDERTDEAVIVERARALFRSGAAGAAIDLLECMAISRRRDYAYQFGAGRLLSDARQHNTALPFYRAAFAIKPTAQAAERIFASHMAVEDYAAAAASVAAIFRDGSQRPALAKDLGFLLQRLKPGDVDPEVTDSMALLYGDDHDVRTALLPHLIETGDPDSLLSILDQEISEAGSWGDEAILNVMARLEARGEVEHLFRVAKEFGGTSDAVGEAGERALRKLGPTEVTQFMMPRLPRASRSAAYQQAAKQFAQSADAEHALELLRLIPSVLGGETASVVYATEKRRFGALVGHVLDHLDNREDVVETLAKFIATWVSPQVRAFFGSAAAKSLVETINSARRQSGAAAGSKRWQLRQGYFGSYVERRANLDFSGLADAELCDVAAKYFATVSRQRANAVIPVGDACSKRLHRQALSLNGGNSLDVLGTVGLLRSRAELDLEQSDSFGRYCVWYLTQLVPTLPVPPEAIAPTVMAYLGELAWKSDNSGLGITRFLKALWTASKEYRGKFDLRNVVDRHLFVLEIIANEFADRTQYLPFFGALFSGDGAARVLDRLVQTMDGDGTADLRGGASKTLGSGAQILDALRKPLVRPPAVSLGAEGRPNVLLVGYASKDSGLGRNLRMLEAGLTGAGADVTVLDFEANAEAVSAAIQHWYLNAGASPIVVFAVNAQDVPDFFIKDRNDVLMDCHIVGFFLWELSQIPHVQRLGVALVDEVWAPTQYVADVYAQLAPTNVVGKGLFKGDEISDARADGRDATRPFTFVTVFDFDSSIERKNPLAVVQAFRQAFPSAENVALTVKGSNINPLHWSNAWGQWEKLVEACDGDARINLVTRRYSAAEMTALLRDANCVVSLHRSEGFGYLISDAMAFGTPVIATNYSGNVDFCDSETFFAVPYRLVRAPAGAARWRCDDAQWADPDISAAASQMKVVLGDYRRAREIADRARQNIIRKFSYTAFQRQLKLRLDDISSRRKVSIRVSAP